MSRLVCAALFGVSIFCVGSVAVAQMLSPPSPCGAQSSDGRIGVASKSGSPFSVTYRTTYEHRFVDGNAIHRTLITHEFRDSAGRTRSEATLGCGLGEDGQMKPTLTVNVHDPVAHITMTWQVDEENKIARMVLMAGTQPLPAKSAPAPTTVQIKMRAAVQEYWNTHRHTEKLGNRTIAGLQCDGMKQVTTIPAGEQGNDLPIVTSIEFWVARGVGLNMLQITDDPRTGHTVIEVTDISLTEPPASVFVPPPDYKIEDQRARTAGAP
jgi:hypothetical protein